MKQVFKNIENLSYSEKVALLESLDTDNNYQQMVFNEFSIAEKERYMKEVQETDYTEILSESEIKPTINCTYEDLVNSGQYESFEDVHNKLNNIIAKNMKDA